MFLITFLTRYHAMIAIFFHCPCPLRKITSTAFVPLQSGMSALAGNSQHRGENPWYRKHTNNHHAKLKSVPSSEVV